MAALAVPCIGRAAAKGGTAKARAQHVRVELVSEYAAAQPGKVAWVGVHLKHDPHWHTYWINPGDSGLPTKLVWSLPPGFHAGEIAWPAPKRFGSGGLFNFGYDGEVLLPVPIDIPAGARPGSSARLKVEVQWLVCQEECIPGKTTLELKLPIAANASPASRWKTQFAEARAAQPQASAWQASARIADAGVQVILSGANLPSGDSIDAFAMQTKVVGNAPPKVERRDDAVTLTFAKSDYFTSTPSLFDVLVMTSNARPALVHAPFAADTPASSTPSRSP